MQQANQKNAEGKPEETTPRSFELGGQEYSGQKSQSKPLSCLISAESKKVAGNVFSALNLRLNRKPDHAGNTEQYAASRVKMSSIKKLTCASSNLIF